MREQPPLRWCAGCDDVAVDFDHVQGLHHARERPRERPQARSDLDHGVARARIGRDEAQGFVAHALDKLREGVMLDDGLTSPAKVRSRLASRLRRTPSRLKSHTRRWVAATS